MGDYGNGSDNTELYVRHERCSDEYAIDKIMKCVAQHDHHAAAAVVVLVLVDPSMRRMVLGLGLGVDSYGEFSLFDEPATTDRERAELLDAVHGGGLGGTYGGNPVACAAALGAVSTMREADLNGRARRIEEIVRPRLEALAGQAGVIGDVRGRGAMLAMEFVKPGTTEPDAEIVQRIIAGCRAEGVVILGAGTYGNCIRLLPPLVIGEELLLEALDVLAEVTRVAAGVQPAASPS